MKKKSSRMNKTLHVKQGDTVQVIAGRDRGKTGEITKILRKKQQVVIQGLNMKVKHVKPKSESDPGQIMQIEAPIDSSNVMIYSKTSGIRSRVTYEIDLETGTKVRRLKKNQEIIS
uniref:ribosomal protein L24 n=1 Tax=Timspurckia oligopyrenoides TaxID=708627 RepID=UPI001FCD4509|nr:ribosomal protein L24 [Timspurckia oligopyrenoides]UNJ17553.1 ribosomal protein L24 [Timspurckia oligopyrenoides]